jgi:general secretion pathway protein C
MASLHVLKGCFASVVLASLAAVAYFQAFAVNRLIASAIGNAPSARRPRAQLPVRPAAPPSAAALLERNPFDSTTGPLVERSSKPTMDVVTDPLAAPVCDGPRLYIVSESNEKRWSMATLQGASELRPHMRRVGDQVESKRVEYIGFNPRQSTPAVWLSSGEALCQAVLFGPLPAASPAAPAQPTPERARSLPTERPERLRIVPELKAGRLLGVRLFGIEPKGAFAAIGLQNGDRLEAINGLSMNSPENALALYGTLRHTSDFELRVARRGRSQMITLHLK